MSAAYRSRAEAIRIRTEACRCVATVLQKHDLNQPVTPLAWSLAVFFETYIAEGAQSSLKEFGPKPATRLKIVKTRIVK